MRYIGNKLRLLEFIFSVIEDNEINEKSFCDIFSGTANVAKFFKKKGYKIISNDFMKYSHVFQMAYIKNNNLLTFNGLKGIIPEPEIVKVLNYLSELPGEKDFIYNNYCMEGTQDKKHQRNYFTTKNAMKIDAVRNKLEDWYIKQIITENEYYSLLTSLLEFIPSISNIAGTYGAFLKINDPRMFKPFVLETPELIESNQEHKCFNLDGNELIKQIEFDILYIDPPYNNRQYASNYHILESVASWDKTINDSKTGLRPYDKQKSNYCYVNKCVDVFEDLIINAKCKYILFSYSSEGIIPKNEIIRILKNKGKLKIYDQEYRRYKSNSNGDLQNTELKELIYFVKVGGIKKHENTKDKFTKLQDFFPETKDIKTEPNKLNLNSNCILTKLLNSFPKTENAKRESNNLNSSNVRPFLQWVGGKRSMIEQYKTFFPVNYKKYYEPFVGGGAVFFSLQPSNAIITDNNKELIKTYEAIRDFPKSVISLLRELKKKHSKELYLAIRGLDRVHDLFLEFSSIEIAARMIYLNQTCFNGVYRVNKQGQFNVPIGSSLNRLICDENAIINASKMLKKAKIICTDFEKALSDHGENDFVYLDPPYEPVSKYSDFTRYTKEKFYQGDQLRLKNLFDKLTKSRCKVMLSNSDCDYIRELYKDYKVITVSSSRTLNCKKDRRGKVSEVLIINY